MSEDKLLYNTLLCYGDFFELNLRLLKPKDFIEWSENNFEYVKYNPRKDIPRYGLSITSLDGDTSGIPDLDSLVEYNKENNTTYGEKDFTVPTKIYNYQDLKLILDIFKNNIFRTHVLKLNPGGYFPPHRDIYDTFDSFRLIIPLINFNPPNFNFVLDNKILFWEKGKVYFVNTAKTHYLFNSCSHQTSYWIVINVNLNEETYKAVTKHLKYK